MPHTLVTGANAFVAAHVIEGLIAAGHTVTGSVRRTSAGEDLLVEHPEWKGKVDYVLIEDYAKEGIWDEVFKTKNFDYVVHVAAPLLDNPANTDYDRDFFTPSVNGNISLLKSAKLFAPGLKAIAITGSVNSMTTGMPNELIGKTFTNKDYHGITPQDARDAANPYISYCSSKKEAELAVWDFVEKEKPAFAVTVLLPALIFGPPIQKVEKLGGFGYSSNVFYSLWNGTYEETPATTFPSYIDVRDLAEAHIKALTTPEAANKRFLIGGLSLSYTLIVETLRKLSDSSIPELKGRLPKPSGEDEKVTPAHLEAEVGNKVLDMKLRSAEETFGDAARRILELEKRFGKA